MPRTLMEHAAYELTRAGMTTNEDPMARKVATDVLALIKRFEKQNHDPRSARYVLEAFETLANLIPLTPITDDPDEWEKFEIERKNLETGELQKTTVWTNKRAQSIFSEDEGKTFIDQRTGKTGESNDHIAEAAATEAYKKEQADIKAAKEASGKSPVPTAVLNQVPAGEEATTPQADPAEEKTVLEKQFDPEVDNKTKAK